MKHQYDQHQRNIESDIKTDVMLASKQPFSRSGSRQVDDDFNVDDDNIIIIADPPNDLEDIRNVFPIFQDDTELINYKRSKLSHCDIYPMVLVLILYLAIFATRSNLAHFLFFGPWFSAAIALWAATFFMFFIVFLAMFVHHALRRYPFSFYYILSGRFLSSKIKHRFDDIFPVAVSVTSGLFLYARVRAGQCENVKNIWQSQSCNPTADCFSIPHDQVIVTYMSPLICQLVFKSVRFYIILVSWAVSTMFIMISIVYARAWPQIFTVAYSPLFLFALYESERMMRITFLHNKVVTYHEVSKKELADTIREHRRTLKKVRSLL